MKAALTRYSVLAKVVGVWLLLLLFVAMPLKYAADSPAAVEVIGPVHGFLYAAYVLASLDLAVRNRWPVPWTLGVMLAGTVPLLSFVAERRVKAQVQEHAAAAPLPRV